MAQETPKILCGECIVIAEVPKDPSDDDQLRCPECERVDTVGKALDDARRHATHLAKRALEKKLQEDGRPVQRRTPTLAPDRNLRWISSYPG